MGIIQRAATVAARGRLTQIDWFAMLVLSISAFVLIVFMLYPLTKTVLLAFVASGKEVSFENLTLANFYNFIATPMYQRAFLHTIFLALLSTLLAVLVAVPAAYIAARVPIVGRRLLSTVAVIPIIAPPFTGAYAWIVLIGNQGIVTHYLKTMFGIELPSIYGPIGITLGFVLSFFPFVFLLVQASLASADPYLEESAHVMGASRLKIIRTIALPLATPAIAAGALLVFTMSIGNFDIPSIIGQEYTMMSTLIVYQIHGSYNLNAAAAIAAINVLLTITALALLHHFGAGRRFVTVTSTTRYARQHTSTFARWLGGLWVWTLMAAACAPQVVVIFYSFVERWPGTLWPTRYGLANYQFVFTELLHPIWNTLSLSFGATVLCVLFGTLFAYVSVRGKFVGSKLLDTTVMVPFVMPGIITGVAYLVSFNSGPIVLTGTAAIIMLAFFIRHIAYVFRSVSAGIGQLDSKLDEASAVCGATWGYTMRKVIIPLVGPSILAGGILAFAQMVMELGVTILLYSAQWKTLSIMMYEQLFNDLIGPAMASSTIGLLATVVMVYAASRLLGKGMADMFR